MWSGCFQCDTRRVKLKGNMAAARVRSRPGLLSLLRPPAPGLLRPQAPGSVCVRGAKSQHGVEESVCLELVR